MTLRHPTPFSVVHLVKALALTGSLCAVSAVAAPGEKAPSTDVTEECGANPSLRPGDECIEHIQTGSGLGARDRTFIVKVPGTYDPGPDGAPLLIDLHGYKADGNRERQISGQWAQSNKRGFVAVWPDGLKIDGERNWNGYNCCEPVTALNKPDDVAFLRQVIETVSGQMRIDDRRVYVTGHSAGAAMTHRMGCESADLVRAIAPTSFPIGVDAPAGCQSADHPDRSGPISETTFHGTADEVVAYGPDAPSSAHDFGYAKDSFKTWAEVNGCDVSGRPKADPDATVPGASTAQIYPDCKRGRFDSKPVVTRLVTVEGGKHQIYATPKNENHVDIAEYIWDHVFNN